MPATPGVNETLALSSRYGLANTLVILLVLFFIALFVIILRWLFKVFDNMATANHKEKVALAELVNNGLKSITESLNQNTLVCQEIMRNMKDGFDVMKKADEYHRSDLKEVKDKINEGHGRAESAREKIIGAIKDGGCKAK